MDEAAFGAVERAIRGSMTAEQCVRIERLARETVASRAVEILDLEQPGLFPAATESREVSRCEWTIERLVFVVGQSEAPGAGALRSLVRRDPTVVREIILHLRAIKPPQPQSTPTPMLEKAECTVSRLDRWPGFAKVSPVGSTG